MPSNVSQDVIAELAPTGVLRAGINMANFLLVSGKGAAGRAGGRRPRHGARDRKAPRRAGRLRAVRAAGRARGCGRDRGLGHRPDRRRARTRRDDRVQPCLRRDRGHVPGARGLAAQGHRRGRPSGRAHRDRGSERLRSLAEPPSPSTPSWSALAASMPHSSSSSPTGSTRSPASGRACCRTSRSCPARASSTASFTAVQQAVGTATANAAGARFLRDFVEEAKASGPGRPPDRAPPRARPLGGAARLSRQARPKSAPCPAPAVTEMVFQVDDLTNDPCVESLSKAERAGRLPRHPGRPSCRRAAAAASSSGSSLKAGLRSRRLPCSSRRRRLCRARSRATVSGACCLGSRSATL